MDYNKIESKYIDAQIQGNYRFVNALEVEKVLGYNLKEIKGFKDLSIEHKELVERLICDFINGHGLQAREEIKPISIKRDNGKFVFNIKGSFSYLYDNGEIG